MTTNKSYNYTGLTSFAAFLKPYRFKILFVLLLFAISNVLLAVIPVFIGVLVQTLTEQPIDTGLGWTYAWILVALSSFHDLFWRSAEIAYRQFLNAISFKYETFLFSHVIKRPFPYFVDKMTGKISSYITQISQELSNLLNEALFSMSGQLVGLIATFAILGSLNWQSQVILVIGIIGMFAVGRFTLAYNMRYEAASADVISTKNGFLYDAIANYASVKAFRSEKHELATIDREQQKAIDSSQKAFFTGIVFWGSMSLFVRHFIWATIILMNTWFFLEAKLTIGELATLLSTILIFSAGIWELIWFISQFGQKAARINEAHGYLFGEHLPKQDIDRDEPAVVFNNQITINNLNFSYPDKADVIVLNGISLSIKHGEKIGIVGKSGSGKSTLTKLLLDFYPMPDQSLTIDGRTTSSAELASLVSFVPQDTSLFHRSIAENIAYANVDADERQIVSAARQAYADEFIVGLPDGYNTIIGERGVKLSGGQRQRIAIARAILQQKPVLILDEATSALDSESEINIQQALETLWHDKTVIAIAHRLSTLRHMDRIIVMDGGKIVDEGSHKQLLERDGIYTTLWAHQSGGFIEE